QELVGTQTDFGGTVGGPGVMAKVSSVSYANVAGYAQASLDTSIANVSLGGRAEWNSKVGANFAPRISISKTIERFHAKALYSGAFRSPGIENINLNSSITAEQTQVAEAELGLKLTDIAYASMNAFYMRIANPIVYGVDPTTA